MRWFLRTADGSPVVLLTVIGLCSVLACNRADGKALRVGYFHGGRTALLMRAYERHEFKKRGLRVEFFSRDLRRQDYRLVPPSIRDFNKGGTEIIGKVRGTELIAALLEGKFDLAMVGESSFVAAIHDGKPIVAIAELGHDVKGHSGHVFLMRKGLRAKQPRDYLGKVLVSRRAGAGDSISLKEYLEQAGVDLQAAVLQLPALPRSLAEKSALPKNKVLIADQVLEDEMKAGIANGVIDGGYFHLMSVPGMIGAFDIIRPLHEWSNPELSQALLVCRKSALAEDRERLIAFLEVYIRRIRYEHGLDYRERTKPGGKGLQMAANIFGLNYPQYDIPPTVDSALLRETARLLRKHGVIDSQDFPLRDFIDNSLILQAMENAGLGGKAAPPRPAF
ncbi:MAG: ABC transporter substrate-binding protein [Elusimicrobia bacterium]|nr:ABC transporter substrate-binding protein [Elusimicrobiota bacterium]